MARQTARPPLRPPADTTTDARQAQIVAALGRTPGERMEEWAEFNRLGAQMGADAIRRRHPEYSDHEVFVAMMRKWYGSLVDPIWPRTE